MPRTRALRWLAALAVCLSQPALGDKPKGGPIAAEPPAGFESVDRARSLYLDVFFRDERAGRALATISAGKVRLREPAKIVALIAGIRDKKAVEKALAGELPSNAGRLCRGRPQDDSVAETCGSLPPEHNGVILDEGRLRLHLFVADRHLDPLIAGPRKFLPRPDGGPSLVARMDAAFAGGSLSESDANARVAGIVAWRDLRLRSETWVSTRDGTTPEILALEMDRSGWFYRAGLYRGLGTTVLPDVRVYAAGVSSSTATRVDLDGAFGSSLVVFLSRPAFVDVLRDGRILSTQFYQPGSRAIDTGNLPDGAYEVTLRIRETDGTTREERRFFAKSDLLPPPDQPFYFADAGVIAERRSTGFAKPSSVPIGRVGMRRRVMPNLALGVNFAGTTRDAFAEANVFFASRHVRVSATALGTVRGDWGGSVSVQAQYRRFAASASARYIRAARGRIAHPDDPSSFRFVNGSSVQLVAAASYQFKRFRIGFAGHWQGGDAAFTRETYAFGPNAQASLVANHRHAVQFIGEFQKTEKGYAALAKITWRWNAGPRVVVNADAGTYATRSPQHREIREMGRLEAIYQPPPILDHEIVLQPSIVRDGPLVLGLYGASRGPLGRGSMTVQQIVHGAPVGTSYGATYSANIAIDGGGVALGGRDPHLSGVIVKLRGPRADARYKVYVDGAPKLTLRAGQTAPLFLAPYKTYDIELKPADADAGPVRIAKMRRRVVLYPGTAQTLAWSVEPVTIVYGRALGRDGTPIAHARITGAASEGETDALGYFQVEMVGAAPLIFQAEGAPVCTAKVAAPNGRRGFARVGNVRCAPTDVASARSVRRN